MTISHEHRELRILCDEAKQECDHHDSINKSEFRQKTLRHTSLSSNFVVQLTTKGAPVFDVVSKVTESMITQLTIHVATNIIELFVQTLVVL